MADNKIASVDGQDFYPSKRFPNDHFEVATAFDRKGSMTLLKKYNYGSKIKPVKKLNGQQKWDLLGSSRYPDPEKLEIFDGRLDTIESYILEHKNR